MQIVYNSQIFRLQKYGGISRYIVNLAERVAREEQVVVSAGLYVNDYLKEMPQNMIKGKRLSWCPPKIGRLLNWTGLVYDQMVVARYPPDIIHETYYSCKAVRSNSIPSVITVHDMIHERFANLFSHTDNTATHKLAAVTRAQHVICISENTRKDLLELYDLNPDNVSVVYHGYEGLIIRAESAEYTQVISNSVPYLLYVGDRLGYKNFKTFLRAYARSKWLRDNFRIVCFGGGQFRGDEIELIRELSIKPRELEQVSGGDNMLAVYYKNAAVFVYPSLYEGFGIPPLEAMALGCPVICSNTSSIPEVVGDSGEYFDPQSIESMSVAVENVLQSTERHAELIRKGFIKCAEYSWDRCAAETMDIYRGLAKLKH